ncbi:hypothetical protein AKJ09_05678 [Labilithrix luteola]|uniref:Uncharacterized protein n=1 Tax=Labilithrix luteola TaxID=1391654 RepID=A0A0K1Q0S4_9BACT|nr:hypothetical protein [Labilithrix luteola]AKU99014.1 hypothetical protein AKJ09_05678 [Labilithrix luteola]
MVAGPAGDPRELDALKTRMTRKFTTLADDVNAQLKDVRVGKLAYQPELLAPEGPSTGGGKRALQHLRLRSLTKGAGEVVAGSVNGVEQWAELRDWNHVALVYRLRFKRTIGLTPDEWQAFLERAESVLHGAEITTRRMPPPAELLEEARQDRLRKTVSWAALTVAAVGLFVVAVLVAR